MVVANHHRPVKNNAALHATRRVIPTTNATTTPPATAIQRPRSTVIPGVDNHSSPVVNGSTGNSQPTYAAWRFHAGASFQPKNPVAGSLPNAARRAKAYRAV